MTRRCPRMAPGSSSIASGPRGVSKAPAHLDEWCKDIAPSTELRKWYSHDPALFEEFARRYRSELRESARAAAFAHLRDLAKKGIARAEPTKSPHRNRRTATPVWRRSPR